MQQDSQAVYADSELQTGQYRLLISDGKVSLVSAHASRITILEDLARIIGFHLSYTNESDKFVVLEQSGVSMAGLLESLLDGVDYVAEYKAKAGDNGFTLSRLQVGRKTVQGESFSENLNSTPSIDVALLIPEFDEAIDLGADAQNEDLAARLQFGTVAEKIAAVGELTLDAEGLNAAYQVYIHATSPAVRVAVLELIEAEDNYLARLMPLLSLQSGDSAEAMYALSIVETLDDYSLAPQVAAVFHHHDPAVREFAREVLESITSTSDSAAGSGALPLIGEPRDATGNGPGGGYSGDR